MVARTGLDKCVVILNKIIDPLCGIVGALIASVMLAAMMFLTFADVIGGQLGKLSFITDHTGLIKPIVGSQEMTEIMMLVLVSFALGYCALQKGHIRVDLLFQFTPSRVTRWFSILAYGVSCVFYALITWQGWLFAWDNLSSGMVSSVLLIPIYPFNFLMVAGAAIIVLVFLRDFLESIQEVVR